MRDEVKKVERHAFTTCDSSVFSAAAGCNELTCSGNVETQF
jgi:hypothetical protein